MSTLKIGTNSYGWWQWYQEQGKELSEHLDEALGRVAESGITYWEQSIDDERTVEALAKLLPRHGLKTISMYSGGQLHDGDVNAEVERIMNNVRRAKILGIERLVLNPDPIDWGTDENKSDAQLTRQLEALRLLCSELAPLDVRLDYHTHAPEFRASAREFHHMLRHTRADGMSWNLDVQWLHRGTGNSQLATEDFATLYAERIGSLHIRQTRGGVWCAALQDGDIDYAPIVRLLKEHDLSPLLTIENAYEKGTPRDGDITECHRRSVAWLQSTFTLH